MLIWLGVKNLIDNLQKSVKLNFFPFFVTGLNEFQLPISLPHNIGHPSMPTEFWPSNFSLHPPFNHSVLHQNIIHNYKLPNIHAILSQYMGLNNLGFFGYPQNLSVNNSRVSPQTSPIDSPTHPDVGDK